MTEDLGTKPEKKDNDEKQISLAVVPTGPDSKDIRVEVTHRIPAQTKRMQRRFAAFFLLILALMCFPIIRDAYAHYVMTQELRALQELNYELQRQRDILLMERESLHSLYVIERLAREDLDMVLPGESKIFQAIPTADIPHREAIRQGEHLQ